MFAHTNGGEVEGDGEGDRDRDRDGLNSITRTFSSFPNIRNCLILLGKPVPSFGHLVSYPLKSMGATATTTTTATR